MLTPLVLLQLPLSHAVVWWLSGANLVLGVLDVASPSMPHHQLAGLDLNFEVELLSARTAALKGVGLMALLSSQDALAQVLHEPHFHSEPHV